MVGDSLSAEYGLARGTGWVALLEHRIAEQKLDVGVVNASVSGDTTSGGRSRLPDLLARHRPTHVILELGGNDALRGLPLAMTRGNLAAWRAQPGRAGPRCCWSACGCHRITAVKYAEDFAAMFASVARAEGAALVPFLLKGVADAPQSEALFQADRIHPNAQAQATMLDNVWAALRPLLR